MVDVSCFFNKIKHCDFLTYFYYEIKSSPYYLSKLRISYLSFCYHVLLILSLCIASDLPISPRNWQKSPKAVCIENKIKAKTGPLISAFSIAFFQT